MRRLVGWALLPLLMLACHVEPVPPANLAHVPDRIPNQYVVVLQSDAGDPGAVANEIAARFGGTLIAVYSQTIQGFSLQVADALAPAIARDPRILFMQDDTPVAIAGESSEPAPDGGPSSMWPIDRVDQRYPPYDGVYHASWGSSPVDIYIVDQGISSESPDFGSRLQPGVSFVDDSTGILRLVPIPGGGINSNSPHGTMVAGIAAGTVFGVAKGAAIVPVRVRTTYSPPGGLGGAVIGVTQEYSALSATVAGIDFITQQHLAASGPPVWNSNHPAGRPSVAVFPGGLPYYDLPGYTNNPLEHGLVSPLISEENVLTQALRISTQKGVFWAVSAGNTLGDACEFFPARDSQSIDMLTMAGTDYLDQVWVGASTQDPNAKGSNTGACVSMFSAAGDVIAYAWDGSIGHCSGTSFSAPMAAGAAAVYLSWHPTATPAQVKQALLNLATPGVVSRIPPGSGTPNLMLYLPPMCNTDSDCVSGNSCVSNVCAPPDGGTPGGPGSHDLELVAGTLGGYGWVDGVGSAARFNGAGTPVIDGAGHAYFSDGTVIRKMDLGTNAITTIAGSPGLAGNVDATGSAARFSSVSGLALVGNNTLYVADTGNHTIRRVNLTTDAVTTVAGQPGGTCVQQDGTGTGACFSRPADLTTDGSNLFVSDYGWLRQIQLSTLQVTTPLKVSNTSDLFGGVTYDGQGNLYISKNRTNQGSALQKYSLSSQSLTTVYGGFADGGIYTGCEPSGPERVINELGTDSQGNVFLTSVICGQLAEWSPGATSATILGNSWLGPYGVATEDGGNLLIGDGWEIKQMSLPTQATVTLAGAGRNLGSTDGVPGEFRYPQGLAVDPAGTLYVADTYNQTIRGITLAGKGVRTVAGNPGTLGSSDGDGGNASFDYPGGVAVDNSGNVYVADTGNNEIRLINRATGLVTTFAGNLSPGSADDAGTYAQFRSPGGIACDGLGTLYVADTGNDTIRKVSLSGAAVSTLAGAPQSAGEFNATGASARFTSPAAVTYGAGSLYVADSCAIRQIDLGTLAVTTLAGSATCGAADGTGSAAAFNDPVGLAYDGAGSLYVADSYNHAVRKINVTTGAVTTVVGKLAPYYGVELGPLPGQLGYPYGLALVPGGGGLYLTDNEENAVLAAWF